MTPEEALEEAVKIGTRSPCVKSKRGVVIFHRDMSQVLAAAFNTPPEGFVCGHDEQCRRFCGKLCVHAEVGALIQAGERAVGYDMLHVKVVDGKAVASGPPSCTDCSKAILEAGISSMWLLHENGLRVYSAREFHLFSLGIKSLPVIVE